MNVKLINYTENAIPLIAMLAKSTRKNKLAKLDYDTVKMDAEDELGISDILVPSFADINFVKGLLKVKHYGVLEHVNFTFHVSGISRALTHQLVRHRIGFSFLQMSNRHAKPSSNDYVVPPTIDKYTPKATKDEITIFNTYKTMMIATYNTYEDLIKRGVPIEDARYVLPPAFFTHISFTCNARSLRNFLKLRLAKSAQWEIRTLAQKLFDQAHGVYPALFADLTELRDK